MLAARREARWAVEPDLAALLGSASNASSVEKEEDGEAVVAAMFTAKEAEGEEDVAVRIKKVGLAEMKNGSSSSNSSNIRCSKRRSGSNSRKVKRNSSNNSSNNNNNNQQQQ